LDREKQIHSDLFERAPHAYEVCRLGSNQPGFLEAFLWEEERWYLHPQTPIRQADLSGRGTSSEKRGKHFQPPWTNQCPFVPWSDDLDNCPQPWLSRALDGRV